MGKIKPIESIESIEPIEVTSIFKEQGKDKNEKRIKSNWFNGFHWFDGFQLV